MYDIILAFITAFTLTYFAIPSVINVADKKRLFEKPNERSSHTGMIPSLGGIGIFAGAFFAITFWTPFKYFAELQYILCSLIIMFLVGLKDDLVPISPRRKFLGQIVAATILVYKAEVCITSFYGLFGIYELYEWFSVAFSVVTIVFLINSFNLIDGINGLAGSVGSIIAVTLGTWFYLNGHIALAVVSFSMTGALVGFLKYNYTPAKIFMGDSGSLFVGLICTMLAIQFIELHNTANVASIEYSVKSVPAVAIGILIIPVLDTSRVFVTRILKGHSPFYPDKTHIHHLLLRLGLSHTQGTLTLSLVNIIFILLAFALQDLGTLLLGTIILGLGVAATGILYYFVKKKEDQKRQELSSTS